MLEKSLTPCRGRRLLHFVSAVLWVLWGSGSLPAARALAQPAAAPVYRATIVRTRYGIPHVRAEDWSGLGYGYGYIVASDNLCTLAQAFATYRGERSLYFGAKGKLPYPSTLEAASNLDLDFFFRFIEDDATIASYRAAQPRELSKLVTGYAAGYSRYVSEIRAGRHPGRHADCRDAAWLQPIAAADIYRRLFALGIARSETSLITQIATAAPPATTAAAATDPVAAGWAAVPPPVSLPELGSNAVAFGADATGSAHGLLLGNPHWFWFGPDRFYQVQLQIPGVLRVQGASILGVPLVMIGFNRDVAWSHTVSTAKRFTYYRLRLVPDDPTAYVYNGQVRRLQSTTVAVKVRQDDGTVRLVERTLYRSHFGPMLAKDWSRTEALSVRGVNSANDRAFRNWMRWSTARSLDELSRVQREETAVPWVNTIAAGRNDPRVWYADIGAIPNVSDTQYAACKVAPLTLDGSRADCEWGTDPDSRQPGTIGPARLPSLLRRDFVANMNDSFWLANPGAPLTGYPRIVGNVAEEQSYRTRLGLMLAGEARTGSPAGLMTAGTLREWALDSRSLTAELFLDAVLAGPCRSAEVVLEDATHTPVRISDACRVLTAWDRHGNLDSVGAHIWDTFWGIVREKIPAAELYRVAFDPADPVRTPRELNAGHPGVAQALGQAIRLIEKSPYPLAAPRRAYQVLTGPGGGSIPLPGGCGFDGYFTAGCTRFEEEGVTVVPGGNSYLQVVAFRDKGPEAWTLMVASESTDPASPWFRDYTRAYSAKQWYRAPFDDAEVAADAVETVRLASTDGGRCGVTQPWRLRPSAMAQRQSACTGTR